KNKSAHFILSLFFTSTTAGPAEQRIVANQYDHEGRISFKKFIISCRSDSFFANLLRTGVK
ncbi:hypothetical protein, partial [Pseudomonas aeruginosa]|uniref:hypothetical protein n=1 Tax=Pseudomonas aeruginosa TaxID=287 RepID=UPI001C8C7142